MRKIKRQSTSVILIKQCIKEKRILLLSIMMISIMVVLITSLSPIVYKTLIDNFIPKGLGNQVLIYVIILICIPMLSLLLAFWKDRLIYEFSNVVSEELRRRAYNACLHMEYHDFEQIGYQKAKQTLTREVGQVCDVFLFGECVSVVNNVLQITVTFVILLHLNWILALGCLGVFPVLYFVINKNKDAVSALEKKMMELLGKCDNYLTHALMGIKTIKSSNGQSYEMEEFEAWLDENRVTNWKIKSAHKFSRTILPNVAQQLTYGLLLVVCAYMVMKDYVTMGTLIASVSYIPILFSAMSGLMGTKIGYASISNAIKSLDSLIDSQQECGELTKINTNEIAIQIKNLDFAYDRSDFNVHIDNLCLKKGEMLAVVGDSGSGKSALFDVLCRFYKVDDGAVKVFGESINHISPDVYRSIIRFVSQEIFLWNKSIEENIIYPKRLEEKDFEKYNVCLNDAGLLPFLETLNQKDKTVLGDFGSQISGGEKQRIAIARALYSDYEMLFLDEPTAALDSINSELIFNTILAQKEKGKTIIVVTHDIIKAMRADIVIVMKKGEIVEIGHPEELLLNGSHFRKLYQSFDLEKNN